MTICGYQVDNPDIMRATNMPLGQRMGNREICAQQIGNSDIWGFIKTGARIFHTRKKTGQTFSSEE